MPTYSVIVIGGGHAGVEAAWAAANRLGGERTVALVTLDPGKIGVMSCNPAIGGLAKGQMVREIDALGGLMGVVTDATGIQFKVLNTSKGAAVHGPRAQCDKHAYADEVQRRIASRPEIQVIAGSVERLIVEGGRVCGVVIQGPRAAGPQGHVKRSGEEGAPDWSALAVWPSDPLTLSAPAVVLTTGTFMRGLMHTGESKTPGGRFGEAAAVGISGALRELGFELGRLKTGTPPRLRRSTIRWDDLEPQRGDDPPTPFSELSGSGFPRLPQVECRITATCREAHDLIRANLHRAPMFSGQIESAGPRYCPSLEDKVVRFADRDSHHVYLEPESLRPEHAEWVYCNGISTSLPADVQDGIVRRLPGCERAEILRYGYAVEYDMVRPHQISATAQTKIVRGLFLAGQINGTSGYEEAAGQGLVAGLNAARCARGQEPVTLGRDEAYIGVLMDDLATKTPVEPYRMFTSRAEHRLLLRADNAPERLTPMADRLGLLDHHPDGAARRALHARRTADLAEIHAAIDRIRHDGKPLADVLRRAEFTVGDLARVLSGAGHEPARWCPRALQTAATDRFYAAYVERSRSHLARARELERRRIPDTMDFLLLTDLRTEARHALAKFRPSTLGQAGRLEGLTPADVTLLAVLVRKHRERTGAGEGGEA
jgi:tRNA uridine 5-carboxymethylaminomethyl modification enzyme